MSKSNITSNEYIPPKIYVRSPIKANMILEWLHSGVADTHRCGGASLFYGVVFAVTGILIHTFFSHHYWLLAGLTTGFLLLGPFLAMGLYDLSRRINNGEKPLLIPSLTAWTSNFINIFLFAALLLLVFFVWTRLSFAIFTYYFNGRLPTFIDVVINVMTLKQPVFALIYFSVGGLFAALIFAMSVIAMPLMLDKKVSAFTAAITSLRTCIRNPLVMFLWAFCIVVLVGFGFATSFMGLIATMPVAGHASWHVYRDLIAIET